MTDGFKKLRRVHFIGIGGIGISAIARMFLLAGKKVSGSDAADSEIVRELARLGAKIKIGHKASHIPKNADLIIYTLAIASNNPELSRAKELSMPVISYPESLGLISKDKFTIAVSGTHGKTTTTAMIGKMLIDAGLDPTVIVGSLIRDSKNNHTNFIGGQSKFLVVEACEYRRSFLNVNPTIAVITNIDDDHLDYYKDMEDITQAFGEFAAKVPKEGFVVTNLTDKNIKRAVREARGKVFDYKLQAISYKLKVPGKHNILNAQAALAVAEILGIKREVAEKSLADYAGVWRRFEFKGKTNLSAGGGALVYDDYAHHPTEIKATLAGARELYPKARIKVVFQPHLYSRTKLLLPKFARAWKDADEIILAPIFAAREPFDPTISSEILAKSIKAFSPKKSVKSFGNFEEIEKYLRGNLKRDEVLFTMGAGEAYKIAENLVN